MTFPRTAPPPIYASAPLDSLARCGQPDAPALILRDHLLTFAELDAAVGRVAAHLSASGYEPGQRVATWLTKSLIACIMPLATARAGLVHVPINPQLKRAQVDHILTDSGAGALIVNAGRMRQLDPAAGCALIDEDALAAIARCADAPAAQLSCARGNDLAALLYTSGSTGRPKGVMLSHANLWLGAESVATYLGLGDNDRTLAVLPLSFDYGQNQLLAAWYAGGAAVPLDYLLPRDVEAACARHAITTLAAVPPLWVQLLERDWAPDASAHMRRVTNSGGALTPDIVRGLRRRFPTADIFAMYGLTEAFRSTYLDPALIETRPTSVGKAIPYAEVRVVRADGSEAADDEAGELVHCGPLVAQGYWRRTNDGERFRPAPVWARHEGMAVWSGDLVRRDADGFIHFISRADGMIKSLGHRVSPTDIEAGALASGVVAECAAFGVADARQGQVIVLIARALGDGAGATDALMRHLQAALPGFMQPGRIEWRRELPRNANGKIDRAVLQAELAA